MSNKKTTRNEHIVSELILKHHSSKIKIKKNKKIYYTYVYDKINDKEWESDISKVCSQRDIYELYDEDGKINPEEQNLIEDFFANVIEPNWGHVIQKILSEETINEKDELWLCLLFVLQILKTPLCMEMNRKLLKDETEKAKLNLNNNQVDRYMKLMSLPHGKISPELNPILDKALSMFKNKKLIIYRTNTSNFILSRDKPILILSNNLSEEFYFPIASNVCLGFINEDVDGEINDLDRFIRFINMNNYENTNRFLYSSESIKNRKEQFYENNRKEN